MPGKFEANAGESMITCALHRFGSVLLLHILWSSRLNLGSTCTVTIFFTKLPGMIDPLLLQVNLESREYACFVSTWSFQHVILIGGHSPLKFLLCRWVCRLFLATWSVASPSVGHAEVMLSQASAPWGSRRRSWGLGEPLGWTVWGCRPWSETSNSWPATPATHEITSPNPRRTFGLISKLSGLSLLYT